MNKLVGPRSYTFGQVNILELASKNENNNLVVVTIFCMGKKHHVEH